MAGQEGGDKRGGEDMSVLAQHAISRSQRLRDKVRNAEVKRLFAEQQDDSSEWPAAEHALLMSPWREKRTSGDLGPWYGPPTESAYEREMRAYQDTRESGSLWDEEEAAKYGARAEASRIARTTARYDIIAVRKYVRANDVTPTELKVFYAFWEDELSVGRVATKLGLVHTNVAGIVRRLRLKAQGRTSEL